MLFRLTFRADHLILPLAYQTKVQGMIYQMTRRAPGFGSFLHDKGYGGPEGRPFKLFCFSRLTGPSQTSGGQICFPHEVRLQIRTADPAFGALLEESLAPGTSFTLGGQEILLLRAQRETLQLHCAQVKLRMASPMTVYTTTPERKTVYYNPLEDCFSALINQNYRRKWEDTLGSPPPGDVALYALSVGSRDKLVTRIKGIWVTAWGGEYLLKGPAQALTFLYHTGLGAKNSMGFGLFDLLRD